LIKIHTMRQSRNSSKGNRLGCKIGRGVVPDESAEISRRESPAWDGARPTALSYLAKRTPNTITKRECPESTAQAETTENKLLYRESDQRKV
jgi:hypothetical protein